MQLMLIGPREGGGFGAFGGLGHRDVRVKSG